MQDTGHEGQRRHDDRAQAQARDRRLQQRLALAFIGRRRRLARPCLAVVVSGFLGLPCQTLAMQGLAQCILSGLLALATYSYAVTVLGASRASAFVSLTPALTAMVAALTLGEWPGGMAIAAILVVGVGVALASGAASGISFKRRLLPRQS